LEEASRPLTAFSVAGRGQFQFRRMPFGLHSAAGTFQALVDRLFTPDLEPYVFAYLDDIIVSTPDFETHLNILRIVFDKLKKGRTNLKGIQVRILQAGVALLRVRGESSRSQCRSR
jgi:hypothetical protein